MKTKEPVWAAAASWCCSPLEASSWSPCWWHLDQLGAIAMSNLFAFCRDRLSAVCRSQGDRAAQDHRWFLYQEFLSRLLMWDLYYYMRTKPTLKKGHRRSSKLSLLHFLSYFFLFCVLYSSVRDLEPKYSCKVLALWLDIFSNGRKHSTVNVQDRGFSLIQKNVQYYSCTL